MTQCTGKTTIQYVNLQCSHITGSNISNTGDINVLDVGGREVFTAAYSAVFLCTLPAIKCNCLKKCLGEKADTQHKVCGAVCCLAWLQI